MTYILLIVAIVLSLLTIALLAIAGFKLRRWFWATHTQISDLHKALMTSRTEMGARIATATLETINANSLGQLGQTFPVFLGSWSIDAFLGRWLIQHLLEDRPRCILELGSGSSTVLIARCLHLLGETNVRHLAVDHESKYLKLTRDISALNGVAENIEFLHCPLVAYPSIDKLWYSGLVEKIGPHKIDLLIIDGPPGPLQDMSRYPALPLLKEHLAEHCTIVLDDAIRDEERAIAQRWANENSDFTLSLCLDGHGLAILKR